MESVVVKSDDFIESGQDTKPGSVLLGQVTLLCLSFLICKLEMIISNLVLMVL